MIILTFQLIKHNMAKIILKTNLANNNLITSNVTVDAVQGKTPSDAEVTIRPVQGYTIDTSQVSHGLLPSLVKNISFSASTGGAIKAKVSFNVLNSAVPLIGVNLPLSIKTTKQTNSFKLTEKTSISSNVFVDQTISLQKDSALNNENVYIVEGEPGSTINIMTKTFTVPDGYYFFKPPSYNISGDRSRYKVLINETTNAKKQLVSKTFNISYTFASSVINSALQPVISFSATSKKEPELIKDKPVKTRKDGKIYSINVSKGLSKTGGVKRISIKGVPGTYFKVLAQHSDGSLYDFKTGSATGGNFIEGIIPRARKGMPFGEYTKAIKVGSVSASDNFNVKLSTEAEIDHKKLAEYLVDKTKQREGIFESSEGIEKNCSLTITLKNGGPVDTSETPDGHPGVFNVIRPVKFREDTGSLSIYSFKGINFIYNSTRDASHVIGDGLYKDSIFDYMEDNPFKMESGKNSAYIFLISAGSDLDNPDKGIQINRAPKFAKEGYKRWDFTTYAGFGGAYDKKQNVAGETILSDFGTSIRHTGTSDTSDGTDIDYDTNDWNIKDIKISVRGLEFINTKENTTTDGAIYKYVLLTIENIEGKFGKDDLTIELNLKNFLSTITY